MRGPTDQVYRVICSDKASNGQSNVYTIGNTDISGDATWSMGYGTGAEYASGVEILDTVKVGSISASMTLSVGTTDCNLPAGSDGILGLSFAGKTLHAWIRSMTVQPADHNQHPRNRLHGWMPPTLSCPST